MWLRFLRTANSIRIHFGSIMTCRERSAKTHTLLRKNQIHDGEKEPKTIITMNGRVCPGISSYLCQFIYKKRCSRFRPRTWLQGQFLLLLVASVSRSTFVTSNGKIFRTKGHPRKQQKWDLIYTVRLLQSKYIHQHICALSSRTVAHTTLATFQAAWTLLMAEI